MAKPVVILGRCGIDATKIHIMPMGTSTGRDLRVCGGRSKEIAPHHFPYAVYDIALAVAQFCQFQRKTHPPLLSEQTETKAG
ncbi:MAG: hypothetical protein ACI3VX_01050 [Faecousia sp.]